eukprot:CAMPEP_0197021756 /NCGR_PEP_ID=MMETSP1384-20130603/2690_1 /TAXON_ID=29189 /ORGANISM="Ammonia sp." /LENGTH=407 /DNA_ID=CAMNT_0042449661 /DNA_START=35 /DNA_END=1258 /DNA_ORIENTATION=+
MGCVSSVPQEVEYNSPQSRDRDANTTPITPSETLEKSNSSRSAKPCYDKVLSSPGQLPVPPAWDPWFPRNHAHKAVRKLFKYRREIGEGCTGCIHEVEYQSQVCVMKRIEKGDEWGRMLFTTEARVLSKLRHAGIIQFIDMFMDDMYYYLLLEKADFDLAFVMKQKGHLSEGKTRRIVYALLKAVKYLHRKGLAHRDLKPENIVFVRSQTDCPRLIDFGDVDLAKDEKMYTEFVGTPPYMSPERLGEHNGYQLKKSDIWALGVIAYEMYTGERCFGGTTQKEVFGRIIGSKWSWPSGRTPSKTMQDFVRQCLNPDADQRLSAEQALQHEWFETVRKQETVETAVELNVSQRALIEANVDKQNDAGVCEANEYKRVSEELDSEQDGLITTGGLWKKDNDAGAPPSEVN